MATPIAVTATGGGGASGGIVLRVVVLTQAKPAAAQTGATAGATNSSSLSFDQSITTTQTGSRVYGAASNFTTQTAFGADANSSLLDDVGITASGDEVGTFKATALTGTPGATTIGFSTPASDAGSVASVEILTAGTLTEDASAPPSVNSQSATQISTATFNPPPGSLLVAMVAAVGTTPAVTMAVTGGGLVWTALKQEGIANANYAGIFIADFGFKASATNTAAAVAHTSTVTLTIPASVVATDIMYVIGSFFTFVPTSPGINLTSTGGSWTDSGLGLVASPAAGGLQEFAQVWKRVATGADAGATLTFAFTGTQGSTDQFWWDVGIIVYSGNAFIDTDLVVSANNTGTPAVTPTSHTNRGNDWAVYFAADAVFSSGSITGTPSGTTVRGTNVANAGICLSMADTNGSVGASGTTIGGGSFATTGNSTDQYVTFTIGLATQLPSGGFHPQSLPPGIFPPLSRRFGPNPPFNPPETAVVTPYVVPTPSPIVVTELDSGGTGTNSNNSQATNSVSPSANAWLGLSVVYSVAGGTTITGVTGLGLTWTQTKTVTISASTKLDLWTAVTGASAPTPGAVTITFGTTGATRAYDLEQATNVNLATPLVVANEQTNTGGSGNPTITFNPPAQSQNRFYFANGEPGSITTVTPAESETWANQTKQSFSSPSVTLETQLSPDSSVLIANAILSSASAWGAIGVELNYAPAPVAASASGYSILFPPGPFVPMTRRFGPNTPFELPTVNYRQAITFAPAAVLSGSGTLTASGAFSGTASLSGSGTLTATGQWFSNVVIPPGPLPPIPGGFPPLTPQFGPTVPFTTPTVLYRQPIAWQGAASLSGSGTLTASGAFGGFVALSGSGSLTASGVLAGTATFSGTGTLTATATILPPVNPPGPLPPTMFPPLSRTFGPGVPFTNAPLFASVHTGPTTWQGVASLSGSGTLTATGALAGSANLSGTGSLTATGAFAGATSLSGSGTLTATGAFAGAATLSGSGSLTASGAFAGSATLIGSGTLTAQGAFAGGLALVGTGSLTAQGTLAGTAAFSGSGTLGATLQILTPTYPPGPLPPQMFPPLSRTFGPGVPFTNAPLFQALSLVAPYVLPEFIYGYVSSSGKITDSKNVTVVNTLNATYTVNAIVGMVIGVDYSELY